MIRGSRKKKKKPDWKFLFLVASCKVKGVVIGLSTPQIDSTFFINIKPLKGNKTDTHTEEEWD